MPASFTGIPLLDFMVVFFLIAVTTTKGVLEIIKI